MNEMRSFPRLRLACDIEYSINSVNTLKNPDKAISKTKDIGKGGICLITYTPLNKGDVLTLSFRLKGHDNPIEAVGRVVWTQVFEIGSQKGYDNGIEFIDISEESKHAIETFVQNLYAG